MPEIKAPKKPKKVEEPIKEKEIDSDFTDSKEEFTNSNQRVESVKPKYEGVVSAYDEQGNAIKPKYESPKLSKKFKVLLVFVYAGGLILGLAVILLMTRCSGN